MKCRACFLTFDDSPTEKLCRICKDLFTVDQKKALCEYDNLFQLISIEDQENKRIKLWDAIPNASSCLCFTFQCDSVFDILLPFLTLIPKDLLKIIDSYSCEVFCILVHYNSHFFAVPRGLSYSFTWIEADRTISLLYQKNRNGQQHTEIFWDSCDNITSRKATITVKDWEAGIHLETLIPDCPHPSFLKSLSFLFRCLPSKFWEFRSEC